MTPLDVLGFLLLCYMALCTAIKSAEWAQHGTGRLTRRVWVWRVRFRLWRNRRRRKGG